MIDTTTEEKITTKPKKSVSPWVARHKQLCKEIHETYIQKDRAYGSSFHDTYRDLGIISAITRMSDKWNRITNLAKNPNVNIGDEPLIDSLKDLANYCLLTVMELEQDEKKNEK